jgi:hypothetical protein
MLEQGCQGAVFKMCLKGRAKQQEQQQQQAHRMMLYPCTNANAVWIRDFMKNRRHSKSPSAGQREDQSEFKN